MESEEKKQIIQFPWPFSVNKEEMEVDFSGIRDGRPSAMIVLKKSIDNPWSSDFITTGVKWDIEKFKPWGEGVSEELVLNQHLLTQWPLHQEDFEKVLDTLSNDHCPSSPLEEVRKIVTQAMSISATSDRYCFAIVDHRNPDKFPALFLRVISPLRCSPLGAPILAVTVADEELACSLIMGNYLDSEQHHRDHLRILFDGKTVGNSCCYLHYYSDEGLSLLCYMLRLNSIKMEPTLWQSKNFPNSKCSPWLATFLSPLYSENVQKLPHSSPKEEEEEENQLLTG